MPEKFVQPSVVFKSCRAMRVYLEVDRKLRQSRVIRQPALFWDAGYMYGTVRRTLETQQSSSNPVHKPYHATALTYLTNLATQLYEYSVGCAGGATNLRPQFPPEGHDYHVSGYVYLPQATISARPTTSKSALTRVTQRKCPRGEIIPTI